MKRVCETFCERKCRVWELTSTPGFVGSFILVQTMSSGFHVSKETGALLDSQHRTQKNTGFNNTQEEAHWSRTQWTNQPSTSLDGLSKAVLLSCNKKFYRIISQAVLCHLIFNSNEFPIPLFFLFLKLFKTESTCLSFNGYSHRNPEQDIPDAFRKSVLSFWWICNLSVSMSASLSIVFKHPQ